MKQNKESNKTHQKIYLNFFINDPRKPNLYYQSSINNDSHNQDLNKKHIPTLDSHWFLLRYLCRGIFGNMRNQSKKKKPTWQRMKQLNRKVTETTCSRVVRLSSHLPPSSSTPSLKDLQESFLNWLGCNLRRFRFLSLLVALVSHSYYFLFLMNILITFSIYTIWMFAYQWQFFCLIYIFSYVKPWVLVFFLETCENMKGYNDML